MFGKDFCGDDLCQIQFFVNDIFFIAMDYSMVSNYFQESEQFFASGYCQTREYISIEDAVYFPFFPREE